MSIQLGHAQHLPFPKTGSSTVREEKLPIATARASFHHRGFGGLVQAAVSEDLCTALKLHLEGR